MLILPIDTPPTRIYTLSLHDALPISGATRPRPPPPPPPQQQGPPSAAPSPTIPQRRPPQQRRHRSLPTLRGRRDGDRKSTRLNSSHPSISYAVFCLKKKKSVYSRVNR